MKVDSKTKFMKALNSSEQQTGVFLITPEIASYALDNCNSHNRKKNKRNVSKIVSSLRNNQWVMNGESLVFSDEKVLIDGQHRLMACVEANIPFETIVVFGVQNKSAFDTHGQAMPRTAHQVLDMNGFVNSSGLATWCKHAVFFESVYGLSWSDEGIRDIKQKNSIITRDSVLAKALSIQDDVIKRVSILDGSLPRHLHKSVVCGMYIVLSSVNELVATAFFEKLLDGIFNDKKDPIYLLKRFMENNQIQIKKFKSSLEGRYYISCFIVRAWNMYIIKENMKSCIYHSRSHKTPVPLTPTQEQIQALGLI